MTILVKIGKNFSIIDLNSFFLTFEECDSSKQTEPNEPNRTIRGL